MKAGNKYREALAKRTQANLVEMGCILPPIKQPLKAEKPAPIDNMVVPNITVDSELVLKYGRRLAMLLTADAERPARTALAK